MQRLALADLASRMTSGPAAHRRGPWQLRLAARLRLVRRRMSFERGLAAAALSIALVAMSWTWQVTERLNDPNQLGEQAAHVDAGAYSYAGMMPALFGSAPAPLAGVGFGDPLRVNIPTTGGQWISPAPTKSSGLIAAWAKLSPATAATAIGSISKDKRTWIQVMCQSANANRSMPYVNLVLPVPEGYYFRLQLTGAKGQGLEIVEERGGLWFPMEP